MIVLSIVLFAILNRSSLVDLLYNCHLNSELLNNKSLLELIYFLNISEMYFTSLRLKLPERIVDDYMM